MAQSVKPIPSPVPEPWYPTLAVLMLAAGLIVTAFFFIYEATSSKKNRSLAKELHFWGGGICLPGFWILVLATRPWVHV